MSSWKPISKSSLESLVSKQLQACTLEQIELFSLHRVDFYKVPIHRLGAIEEVFVVAEHPLGLVYYEDVEEGFEISMLGVDGKIPNQACNQYDLRHVLHQIKRSKI
jgi:hypothetical protein